MSIAIVILCVISALLAITMLFAKNPITSALCLLGVLIMTAAIYGLIGEHMVATIQLVVYAGAIMVLFILMVLFLYWLVISVVLLGFEFVLLVFLGFLILLVLFLLFFRAYGL